jgi:exodeoxyribonuclease V alpha subunit
MPNKITTIVGVVSREWHPIPDSDFITGQLDDKTKIVGNAPRGDLVAGLEYEFQGFWDDHPEHGKQFKFRGFTQKKPHSRDAIVAYLTRFAPHPCGLGPAAIGKLVDKYGSDTMAAVRDGMGNIISACPRITRDQAWQIVHTFRKLDRMEDTTLALSRLFKGRGFGKSAIGDAIAKWGISAHETIKARPFLLLVEKMPGAGFGRVDRMYCDLGHPLDDPERQMFCVWHVVHSDMSGSTWLPAEMVCGRLRESITGTAANPVEAIKAGVRDGWLATRVDGEGRRWIADAKRAANEETLANYLR